MSTEEENKNTQIVETEQPDTTPQEPETTPPQEPEQEEVNWNDVPDPEDGPADGPEDAGTSTEAEDKHDDAAAETETADEAKDETDGNGAANEEDDPYSFLDELDNADNAEHDNAGPDDAAAEKENGDSASGGLTLDSLKVDDIVSDLPDDLKEFASNYPEESRMAAEMARQMLKKLGFDQLRADVKKYSGSAEQFVRSQKELQAKAAQDAFEQAVTKIHPDVKEIIIGNGRRAFSAWLKAQPKFLQQRFRDTRDPEEAADILTRYKSSREGQTRAQQRRASKFSGVRSATSAPRVRSNDGEVGWNDVKDEDVPEY